HARDPACPVRDVLALVLGEAGGARETLEAILGEDPSPLARASAAHALDRAGDSASAWALARGLSDRDLQVARASASALLALARGALGDAQDTLALRGALEDGDESVRRVAAESLAALDDRDATPAIARALARARDERESIAHARALGKLGDPRGVRALEDAL